MIFVYHLLPFLDLSSQYELKIKSYAYRLENKQVNI